MRARSFKEFKSRINKTEKCWLWMGPLNNKGYGWVNRRDLRNTFDTRLAHRIMYMITFGEIPEGLSVCHACDNPKCVNPEHLFLGTHKENMLDMKRKGRGTAMRFSDHQISVMRTLWDKKIGASKIAKRFNVDPSVIVRLMPKRPNPQTILFSAEESDKIIALHGVKTPMTHIAKQFGVSPDRIKKELCDRNVFISRLGNPANW